MKTQQDEHNKNKTAATAENDRDSGKSGCQPVFRPWNSLLIQEALFSDGSTPPD
ncbi:hypothetical protein DFP91_4691 [Pseudorhodoplanes sinuspersici]|nr:hypothetical protein DFP91_4691 [Pseudorhodoplanes sinuspersici]